MPTIADRARRLMPSGLTGLAATACAAYCVLPALLAAGVIGGASWAAANRFMPGVAAALAILAGVSWWWASNRRHASGCSDGNCSCGKPEEQGRKELPLRSDA